MPLNHKLDAVLGGSSDEVLWSQFIGWLKSAGREDLTDYLSQYNTFDDFAGSRPSVEFINYLTDLWNKWMDSTR